MKPLVALAAVMLAGCAAAGPRPDTAELKKQVIATERAFAATMAARDHAKFVSFLAEDTVWFGPGDRPLRGKQAVADAWKPFYEKAEAPFSWEPSVCEVLDSGDLALTSGPVHDPSGKQVATFTSIWRQEKPGVWRIVFDRGCPHCPARK
jgi:ketosteroid isomerase-like protein